MGAGGMSTGGLLGLSRMGAGGMLPGGVLGVCRTGAGGMSTGGVLRLSWNGAGGMLPGAVLGVCRMGAGGMIPGGVLRVNRVTLTSMIAATTMIGVPLSLAVCIPMTLGAIVATVVSLGTHPLSMSLWTGSPT